MKKMLLVVVLVMSVLFVAQAQNPVSAIPKALNGLNPENLWRWGYTVEQVKDYVLSSPGWHTIDSVDAPQDWLGYESIDKKCVLLFRFNDNGLLFYRVIVYLQQSENALAMNKRLSSMQQTEASAWYDEKGKASIKRRFDGNNVQYILTCQQQKP